MTTLLQQIEEMRVQVNELAGGEQKLLHALGDALTCADHQLLHDVRNVTAEHERRRRMVLKELQALALSIGSFPIRASPSRRWSRRRAACPRSRPHMRKTRSSAGATGARRPATSRTPWTSSSIGARRRTGAGHHQVSAMASRILSPSSAELEHGWRLVFEEIVTG